MTKALAITGAILAWFPILAPVGLTLALFINQRIFRFDYLMPAELFPAALLGGGLLYWAARRQRSHYRIIGWSLVLAIVMLVAAQGLAVFTGLASGETAPTGWPWALVLASLVIFWLALIALGLSGLALVLKLIRSRPAR
jgi:phosphoglycerol transferase MdoB-like AlkP superfamily enzyme